MKILKTIRELVTVDIYKIWDTRGVKFAIIELRKLYFAKYNKLDNMEDKRLILWNLIVACIEYNPDDTQSVKPFTEQLKKDMDNTPNYKVTDKNWYVSMLTAYRDCHKDELTQEEIIEINIYCYRSSLKYASPNHENYIMMLVAKFNLALSMKNYNTVIEVIETVLLHTNKKEYGGTLIQMTADVKRENIELYKKVLSLIQNKETKLG